MLVLLMPLVLLLLWFSSAADLSLFHDADQFV